MSAGVRTYRPIKTVFRERLAGLYRKIRKASPLVCLPLLALLWSGGIVAVEGNSGGFLVVRMEIEEVSGILCVRRVKTQTSTLNRSG
ncbi:hypothetical protein BLA15816_07626 [Burkholderia lata]|nr:hypothetical protein BLA15816_07626 [Burkholderia lata]